MKQRHLVCNWPRLNQWQRVRVAPEFRASNSFGVTNYFNMDCSLKADGPSLRLVKHCERLLALIWFRQGHKETGAQT